jgi:hypothetical protein
VLLQHVDSGDDALECRPAAMVHSQAIVEPAGAIDREAYQETLARQKLRPRVIQQNPVRLEGILDALPIRVAPLQLHDAPEIVDPQQGRLTALPREADDRRLLRLDVLPDERLEHVAVHDEVPRPGVQPGLLAIEAVDARQIARGSRRLGNDMKGKRPCRLEG